jgi:hypothetical protein
MSRPQRGVYAELCAADMPWHYRAEAVNLGGVATIVVRRGPYWIGDYTDPDQIPLEIRRDLELPERNQK